MNELELFGIITVGLVIIGMIAMFACIFFSDTWDDTDAEV